MIRRLAIIILSLAVLTSCSIFKGPKPEPGLSRVGTGGVGLLADDLSVESLRLAIERSLIYLNRVPADRKYKFGRDVYTASQQVQSLQEVLNLLDEFGLTPNFLIALKDDFQFYNLPGPVLFTGYYEPLLEARYQPEGRFDTALYKRPNDMVHIELGDFGLTKKRLTGRVNDKNFMVPYYTRSDIDRGALEGKNLELAWVDPIESFFLQIQGSGQIQFPDGTRVRVNYAAQNGHKYVSLGGVMIKRGLMSRSEMSMQGLKEYLRDHPNQQNELLSTNPSYVFFSPAKDGPIGALNVPVTPGRSIAIDRKIFPGAALAVIRTEKPIISNGAITGWTEFTRLALLQDTGGAIKGPGRADLFFGNGPEAELGAGNLKHNGQLFVLIHKKFVQ